MQSSANFKEIYVYPANINLFLNILAQTFARNCAYYSNYPEYANEHFRSFVDNLGKINLDNPDANLANRIIEQFILAHLTLKEESPTTNLVQSHFRLHFKLKDQKQPLTIVQREQHPRVIKAIKSLDKTCVRYCSYLEKKIDFNQVQEKLYEQQCKQEHFIEKKTNLLSLSQNLNEGKMQEFWFEISKHTPEAFEEKYGCSLTNILNINNKYKIHKLYFLFKLRALLQNEPLNCVENFKTNFNSLKYIFSHHAQKKERDFIHKLGHTLKNFFLIPYKIYSKHSLTFWKSRLNILEAALEKTEKTIIQSGARPG